MMAFTRTARYNNGNFISDDTATFEASRVVSNQGRLDHYDYLTPRFGIGRIQHFWSFTGLSANRRIPTNCRDTANQRTNGKAYRWCQRPESLQGQTPRIHKDESGRSAVQSAVIRGATRRLPLVLLADDGQIRSGSYQAVDQGRDKRSVQSLRLPSALQSEKGRKGSQATSTTLINISPLNYYCRNQSAVYSVGKTINRFVSFFIEKIDNLGRSFKIINLNCCSPKRAFNVVFYSTRVRIGGAA